MIDGDHQERHAAQEIDAEIAFVQNKFSIVLRARNSSFARQDQANWGSSEFGRRRWRLYCGIFSNILRPSGRITQSGLNFVMIAMEGLKSEVSSSVPA
jgi:hypothetical protein